MQVPCTCQGLQLDLTLCQGLHHLHHVFFHDFPERFRGMHSSVYNLAAEALV